MSTKPNHRRGEERRQDHGPGFESHTPAAGCNSTHVARARTGWKRLYARKERRTGMIKRGWITRTRRVRPAIELEDAEKEISMEQEALRARIEAALEKEDPEKEVNLLVKEAEVTGSVTKREFYDALQSFLPMDDEGKRFDAIANTLDGFVGFCAPEWRCFPNEPDIQGD